MRVRDLADYVPVATAHPHITEQEKLYGKMFRKQNAEAERRHRIFDAKRRTIGIDKAGLDAQVEEMQLHKQLDKERSDLYDSQALYFNNVIMKQELEARRKRTELERQTKEYSSIHLNKTERREYDIEHPPKYPPPLTEGADPCGPASCQAFTGEDMGKDRRQMVQAQQQRDWYEQQVFEKAYNKQLQADQDAQYTEMNERSGQIMQDVVIGERVIRYEMEKGRQAFNASMQESKLRNAQELKEEAEQEKLRDVAYQMDSHFLKEDTPFQGRPGWQNKVIFTEYKGDMTVDALDHMIRTRDAQLDEKAERKAAEARSDQDWARHDQSVRRQLIGNQRKEQQTKREKMEQMVRENQAISAAKKAKEVYAQNCVFTNHLSGDFWDQFGTTTR